MVEYLSRREISFDPLVTHRFSIKDAEQAYRTFDQGKSGKVIFEWA